MKWFIEQAQIDPCLQCFFDKPGTVVFEVAKLKRKSFNIISHHFVLVSSVDKDNNDKDSRILVSNKNRLTLISLEKYYVNIYFKNQYILYTRILYTSHSNIPYSQASKIWYDQIYADLTSSPFLHTIIGKF